MGVSLKGRGFWFTVMLADTLRTSPKAKIATDNPNPNTPSDIHKNGNSADVLLLKKMSTKKLTGKALRWNLIKPLIDCCEKSVSISLFATNLIKISKTYE